MLPGMIADAMMKNVTDANMIEIGLVLGVPLLILGLLLLWGRLCKRCGSLRTIFAPCYGTDGVNPGRECLQCGHLWSSHIGTVASANDPDPLGRHGGGCL